MPRTDLGASRVLIRSESVRHSAPSWEGDKGMTIRGRLPLLPVLVAGLFLALSAGATTSHPDVIGTSVSFTSIQETSTFGDPEPLFGAPSGIGNQLLFFPANFAANAVGAGGFDQTGAQLQLEISGNGPLDTLDELIFTEFGDTSLVGAGTAATGAFIGVSGFLTVTETIGGPIAPFVIGFTGTFAPTDTFDLVSHGGVTLFSGGFSIDIASLVPNATKATLSLDNNLFAYSEAGTSATIQKKVVSGPAIIIEVVPEPGTFALLSGGLLALAVRARKRHSG
jgi:hypothetical protein